MSCGDALRQGLPPATFFVQLASIRLWLRALMSPRPMTGRSELCLFSSSPCASKSKPHGWSGRQARRWRRTAL